MKMKSIFCIRFYVQCLEKKKITANTDMDKLSFELQLVCYCITPYFFVKVKYSYWWCYILGLFYDNWKFIEFEFQLIFCYYFKRL